MENGVHKRSSQGIVCLMKKNKQVTRSCDMACDKPPWRTTKDLIILALTGHQHDVRCTTRAFFTWRVGACECDRMPFLPRPVYVN